MWTGVRQFVTNLNCKLENEYVVGSLVYVLLLVSDLIMEIGNA